MTVERVRVGDVLRLERVPVDPDPGVEYVSIGIRSFGKGIFHYEPRPGDQLGGLRFFSVLPDCLVISNIKGWEGAIAVSADIDSGRIASNRFLSYRPMDDDRIDVRWTRWFFLSDFGISLIQRASPGSADRNRTLAIDRFEALEIPLPLIAEQHRVADLLDRLEGAAADLRRRSSDAATLAGALAVSTAARPDLSREAKTRDRWRRVALDGVLELNNREVVVESGTSYEIAGVYSFGRGMFRREAIDGSQTKYKRLHRLHAPQLVMSRLKAWEGALALVPNDLDGWFVSPEFPTFDIDTEAVNAQFLAAVLTSEPFWNRLKGASKGIGARRERVNASRLLEQVVDIPPLEQQRSVAMMLQRLHALQISREQAQRRIDALLPAGLNSVFSSVS